MFGWFKKKTNISYDDLFECYMDMLTKVQNLQDKCDDYKALIDVYSKLMESQIEFLKTTTNNKSNNDMGFPDMSTGDYTDMINDQFPDCDDDFFGTDEDDEFKL